MIFNSLLKSLRNPEAQVTLEYFILFGIVCVLTLVAASQFIVSMREATQGKPYVSLENPGKDGVFQIAGNKIIGNNTGVPWTIGGCNNNGVCETISFTGLEPETCYTCPNDCGECGFDCHDEICSGPNEAQVCPWECP
jgi:uncharacterized protein (UPF0333 family)